MADARMHENTSHYQGKLFPDQATGLTGAVTGMDAAKNVYNPSNDEVDTTSLQGHATHELKKGMNPSKGGFSHARDPNAHFETRQPKPGSGHVSLYQSNQGPAEQTEDVQYITEFKTRNQGLSDEMDKEMYKRLQTS
ncbi:hypothetical protein PsYK624_079110 [Phanerochaete sordida]|uniref:Uncharacterized protein n=1 Tax=Phanerochaete sordida TaxID=48140 RepID=A0A9P3GBS6_9APHY|nr:hypothetical protein PsYK624_079110 [Phanerochaete sordida]